MLLLRKLVAVASVLAAFTAPADATCVCRRVNGQMQPLCQNAIDLPPICPPTVCAITPPSVAPIGPITLPPLGTSSCQMRQVMNPMNGMYQWQQVCQ